MTTVTNLLADISPLAWGLAATLIVLLALGVALIRTRQHTERERRTAPEDHLTRVAAVIATAMSAQGMWRFSGDVLHLDGLLRVGLFAFIEVAVVTSAVRARRNMRISAARAAENPWERPSAGIDGKAVWALTCLTAVLSSLDARSVGEFVFRLAAPLVAAWLWERGMAIERIRLTGRGRIHWRLTPERILVRLGLAEPSERTAGQVDAERRLTRVALAADRVADSKDGWRARWRLAKLKRRGRAMLAHTAVATDPTQKQYLMEQFAFARSIPAFARTTPRPFWDLAADIRSDTSTVTSPTFEVSGGMSTRWRDLMLDDDPGDDVTNADLDTELATLLDTPSDPESVQDDDQTSKRERPDDQDNRLAEEWIRRQCRGRNGVGRRPTRNEVRDRHDFHRFSDGWAGLRPLTEHSAQNAPILASGPAKLAATATDTAGGTE